MKRSNLPVFSIFLLVFAAGCSSNVAPPAVTPTTYPHVTYSDSTKYTYHSNARDTSSGNFDQPIYSSTDTITSTVVATNQTYMSMSNVTILVNHHSKANTPNDTTYIAQDSGNFWHYNYGLEAVNNNANIIKVIGSPVEVGWVLQAKLSAVAGDTWTAVNNQNLSIKIGSTPIAATAVIKAVERSDTSISVQGSLVTAKHATDTVTLTASIFPNNPIVTTVDTYVAASVGVTLNIVHSAQVNLPQLYNGPVEGSQSLLVGHS